MTLERNWSWDSSAFLRCFYLFGLSWKVLQLWNTFCSDTFQDLYGYDQDHHYPSKTPQRSVISGEFFIFAFLFHQFCLSWKVFELWNTRRHACELLLTRWAAMHTSVFVQCFAIYFYVLQCICICIMYLYLLTRWAAMRTRLFRKWPTFELGFAILRSGAGMYGENIARSFLYQLLSWVLLK